jgi:uncharacterized protein involved in exopolysaccharide biosynthesis
LTPASFLELAEGEHAPAAAQPMHWAERASLLWSRRRILMRVTAVSFAASLLIAFLMPKQYKSSASIMPPDQQSSGAMMLAALAGRSGGLGALEGLAGSMLGVHSTTALFENLLRSSTVSGHLIDRFDLQHLYRNRYRIDTAKHLARVTKITDDKKSGVITIEVEDRSPVRARDLVQAYLDELNKLVTQTNTSAAHRERVFIEERLRSVQADLERAQLDLSEFSSKNTTVNIGEQTRAMVDAGARVQAQLLLEQSGLQSLRQIYGDENVRIRETEARIASLQRQLEKMAGTSAPLPESSSDGELTGSDDKGELYPPLRQLPRLAVPYADLYRRVRVQEALYELLTQQYELARIEEAKDVPSVSVIDYPGVPEKKSFPPRLLLTLFLTTLAFSIVAAAILLRHGWSHIDPSDPRKMLAAEIHPVVRNRMRFALGRWRGDA